jgi:hypothetical protein
MSDLPTISQESSKVRRSRWHILAAISKLVVTSIFASALSACAQGFSVSSTTDGHGLFSYTFSLDGSSYVWGLPSDTGEIVVQSHGILDVISPPGWTASVDNNNIINWHPTNGTVYLGEPQVTFSVLSSFTGAITYDQPFGSGGYQMGFVFGSVYTLPDYQYVATGYEDFSFIGPQIPQEPSCPLNILVNGDTVILSWTNSAFTLQGAPSPIGTYTNFLGATSPFTNNISGSAGYFRLILN